MDHFSAKLALIGACALAGTSVGATYTETFDTDAIDNAAVTAAYPDFTLTGTHSVESGVANIAGDGGRMVVSAAAIGAGSDFGMTYTVSGEIGTNGGSPLSYSPTLMISSNLGIEFGQSNAGNQEYFRVIAADFGTNTASTTGIPVQVADIGFDIIDATLYRITADILRNGDGSVQLDVTVEDANSSDVYVMPTLNLNASDAAALFVSYDEAGFRQRGWGTQIADNLSITYQPVPEPGSLALISISAVLAMKRRRR